MRTLEPMLLLFALTDAPELAAYPPSVRQLLVKRAEALLCADSKLADWLQVLLVVSGGLLGVVIGLEVQVVYFSPKPLSEAFLQAMVCCYAGVAVGGLLGGFVGLQLKAWKLRPYLCRVIQDYVRQANPQL